MLNVEVAMLNDPGGREVNEDACGYWQVGNRMCCVVADGAGGHGGGRQAARLAVEYLLQSFSEQPSRDNRELAVLVRRTNAQLRSARLREQALADMYSTIACLVIDLEARRAHWAHAGDTRLYWFRHARLAARTKDHSVVQAMADQGLLAPGDVHGHPRRSELLCALGSEEKDLQVGEGGAAELAAGQDVFLLCTDGAWEHASTAALESTLARTGGAHDWLHALEGVIRASAQQSPGHDNFSALAACVVEHPAAGASTH